MQGIIWGTTVGNFKGETRSLDYGSTFASTPSPSPASASQNTELEFKKHVNFVSLRVQGPE